MPPPRAASSGWSLFRSRGTRAQRKGRGVGERARSALFSYALKVGKPARPGHTGPGNPSSRTWSFPRARVVEIEAVLEERWREHPNTRGRRPPLREARCCDRVRKGATGPVRPSRRPQSDRLATQSEAVPVEPPKRRRGLFILPAARSAADASAAPAARARASAWRAP